MPLVDVTSAPNEPPSSSAVWKASWNCGMFPVGTGTMLSFVSGERWGDKTRTGLPPASGDKLLKRWLVRHHHCGRQQHLRASSSPLLLLGELVAVTPPKNHSSEDVPHPDDGFAESSLPSPEPQSPRYSHDLYPATVSPELRQPSLDSALGLPHCLSHYRPFSPPPHHANQPSLSFSCSHECRASLLPRVSLLWWTKASKKSGPARDPATVLLSRPGLCPVAAVKRRGQTILRSE